MTLHNEQKITIRNVRIEDAENILRLEREVFNEGEFFIPLSKEHNKTIDLAKRVHRKDSTKRQRNDAHCRGQ